MFKRNQRARVSLNSMTKAQANFHAIYTPLMSKLLARFGHTKPRIRKHAYSRDGVFAPDVSDSATNSLTNQLVSNMSYVVTRSANRRRA